MKIPAGTNNATTGTIIGTGRQENTAIIR